TGESSILNQNLVLDEHLALGVRSFCYTLGNVSLAGFSGKCVPGRMNSFKKALLKELEFAAAGKIPAARLKREKTQQYADHLRELRDPVNIAGEIAGGVLYDKTPDAGDAYLKNLNSVTLADVQNAAGKFLDFSRWVFIHQHNGKSKKRSEKSSGGECLDSWKSEADNTVVYAPDNQLPLCNFFLVMPGGALHESYGYYGISRIVAAALTAGCGKYTEKSLLSKMDELGMEFDVSAGANSLVLEFSAPAGSMNKAVDLLVEILSSPAFESSAVEREKKRWLEIIKERAANPVRAALDRGMQLLYGEHPYAFSKCGKIADVAALSREDIVAFFRRCCNSGGRVWGFAGDCKRSDVERWSRKFDKVFSVSEAELSRPEPAKFSKEIQFEEFELDREQTVVLRMIPGPESAENSRLLDIFEILNQAENGLASTLFKSIREERALSYSVGMNFFTGFQQGALSFYAMTVAGAEKEVLQLLDDEIRRLGNCGLSEEEFQAAKAGILFDIGRTFDSCETLLHTAVMDAYYGRSPLELLTRKEKINALSREEFNREIKQYFTAPAGVAVTVLPTGKK
ncbi:MAG: insulinase family protein, partial [Lentisphaeria bacterium]|nr:insulinase family protein [Lentisphaeria bacterium]